MSKQLITFCIVSSLSSLILSVCFYFCVFYSTDIQTSAITGVCKDVSYFLTQDPFSGKGVVTYYGHLQNDNQESIRISRSDGLKLEDDVEYTIQVVRLCIPFTEEVLLYNNSMHSEERFLRTVERTKVKAVLNPTLLFFVVYLCFVHLVRV